MLRLKETMNQYFSDENEKHKADLPLAMLFQRFPDSEVRLKTSKCVVFVQKGDMETYKPEPVIPNEFREPTHAEKVQQYFAEKEALADQIFKEVAQELSKIGEAHLVGKLKTAVTFYESGDWIDENGLSQKKDLENDAR